MIKKGKYEKWKKVKRQGKGEKKMRMKKERRKNGK